MLRRSLLAATLFAPAVQAQAAYPSRSTRLLVGSGAGGASDIVARILAEALESTFPRGLVIDNRPGAGATIAASTVARAAPDGYTLLLSSASMLAINPALMRQLPFDAANDLTHITMLSEFPFVIVVHPSVPATTLLEFGAWARAQPDPVIYGSPNPGSEHHLGMEQLAERLGFRTQHIGFRGGGPATTALLGRQILVGSIGLPPLVPQLREGRLRALAVSTSARSPLMPEVPTIAEAGVEGLSLAVWQGLAGPRGLPPQIVQFLAAAFAEALAKPDVVRKLAGQGLSPRPMPPAEFDVFMAAQRESWGRAARAANISID